MLGSKLNYRHFVRFAMRLPIQQSIARFHDKRLEKKDPLRTKIWK